MNDQEGAPDDIDPDTLRAIAQVLREMGEVLTEIEACAAHDAHEVGSETNNDEYLAFVLSLFFDIREVVDDFLV
ncbi:hypothetical protein PG993_010451 [Apiospora rasikravindrae]|uniref:Uncharacterized protein n=1 Tax=Apiospora rasikravindrae TaxID=990691 RepID=A0ABR1SMC9_9PEZI